MPLALLRVLAVPEQKHLHDVLLDWRQDWLNFLRHADAIVLIVAVAFVVLRTLRALIRRISVSSGRLTTGLRQQQVRTLASVLNSVVTVVVVFVTILLVLEKIDINVGPLLASAGVAGLAIGFGAQTLVHDYINGFFVLLEDQYNLGDTVRVAGLKGMVEHMTLRRTVLRDDDGTVHIIPNSQITVVSNLTRDWAQLSLKVTVAYEESSDKIMNLLRQVGADVRHEATFADDILDVQVPGIDRVGNGEAEYLVLVKTRPNKQYGITREFRRLIKDAFEKNLVKPGPPGRVYVTESSAERKS
ncbi:MAG: mechanosensitive ion channel family protein [Acidobacteria bacterium]|nr:mechanosensitive ion channel family protein [Acidobacteriota bacterium]MBV9484306.1 mechanosensitive ion channel family protein [Acidobacteriota bacterium]